VPVMMDDLVRGDVGQQPVVADPVVARLDIPFENPGGPVRALEQIVTLPHGYAATGEYSRPEKRSIEKRR
jgi:hypothetical protein